MHKIMCALDISTGHWNEPADHLALQLATLAEALGAFAEHSDPAGRTGDIL